MSNAKTHYKPKGIPGFSAICGTSRLSNGSSMAQKAEFVTCEKCLREIEKLKARKSR